MGASGRRSWPWALAIIVLTALAYLPAFTAGFVWDDDDWLTANPVVREADGLARAWRGEPGLQYYPMFFTVLRVEHALWGMNPAGYHAANVALHALDAILVGLILARLGLGFGWWVALLFALHPVHVESVAWVTELKNLLSGAFCLGAVLAWLAFDRRGARAAWTAALLLYAAAVLSKTATATLPAALALLPLWRNGRLGRADLLRLAPFFAVGAALAWVAVRLESGLIDPVRADFALGWSDRVAVAARALFFYPWKLLVPWPLMFNYPRWDPADGRPFVVALVVVGVALAVAWRRGHRGPACAALFYAMTVAPALGFFDVYAFRYAWVADHFQYLASIGPLTLIVAAAWWIGTRAGARSRRLLRVAAAAVLAALGALTFVQARAYHDLPTLWRDTLAKNPGSWIANHNLALAELDAGDASAALRHFDAAIRAKPGAAESWTGRGMARARRGEWDTAVADLDRAVALDPDYAPARLHRGEALLEAGRPGAAAADLDRFLAAAPDHLPALGARARARLALGAYDDARADADRVIALAPRSPSGWLMRGEILRVQRGDPAAACDDWRRACALGDCRLFDRWCR